MNISRLKKLFLYAGIEKEEFDALIPDIRKENLTLLKLFSVICFVMFFLLYIVSRMTRSFATDNSTTYLLFSAGMLLILLLVRRVISRHPALIMPAVYLFEIMLYAFAINVSMLHADRPAVSAVAFLLVNPLLFYERPSRLIVLIIAVVAVFCRIAVRVKTPQIAESDVWNMITFGVVAVVVAVFMMSIKIQALAKSRQIRVMSRTDLLTGVNNRNHYENRLKDYPGLCTENLICVYADVNGLHEMNNRSGHAAGDRMLREVAAAMQQHFGSEHTYRIGGDEFISFRINGDPEGLLPEIGKLKQELLEKGYPVSFGTAVREKGREEWNIQALVTQAENNMYADKRSFYCRSENDRRSR